MYTVTVKTSKEYNVHIESGIIKNSGNLIINKIGDHSKAMIICDNNTERFCLDSLKKSLENCNIKYYIHIIESGEKNKNINTVTNIITDLLNHQFQRTDIIISLGGGVIGDLSGFTASIYKRGIRFINIPTTLLSMVDASVGGKTGIDFNGDKNSVGTFHQPDLVICDPDLLLTLPKDIYRQGFAEIIKYGILCDVNIFENCKNMNVDELIFKCISIKSEYVSDDEYDNSKRLFLNLGHTFAHGIEKISNYSISHGDAVAVGLIYAAEYSANQGLTSINTVKRIKVKIEELEFNTSLPYSIEELLLESTNDKKTIDNNLNLILIKNIGDCLIKKLKISEK